MKLSTLALDVLLVRPKLRQEIADTLGVTDQTVKSYRRDNESNSPLTLISIVELISKESGLTQDQILIDEALAMEMNESDCQQNNS